MRRTPEELKKLHALKAKSGKRYYVAAEASFGWGITSPRMVCELIQVAATERSSTFARRVRELRQLGASQTRVQSMIMKFNNSEIVAAARAIAHAAHGNQTRRDGTPYINHPARVAVKVEQLGGGPDEIAAAWLHDVLEDTAYTPTELVNAGIPKRIVDIVKTLTKKIGQPYDEYLSEVNASKAARLVKIADIIDNLSDTPTRKQVRKYSAALAVLGPQLGHL